MITFNENTNNIDQVCIIKGNVNDIIEINFSEDPIKATIWHMEISDNSILEIDKDEYIPDKDSSYGGHGKHIYKFKALKTGEVHVIFKSNVDVYPKDPKVRKYKIIIK